MSETRRRLRVAALFGSRSVEHEVSIVSAIQAMDAMDPRRYEPIPIFITKEGAWYTGPDLRRVEAFKKGATWLGYQMRTRSFRRSGRGLFTSYWKT